MSTTESAEPSRRLDSWKEIAAYFGRDARTVRRWEQSEALPVHRHLHRARGSVYAFEHELDAWRAGRDLPAPAATRRVSLAALVSFSAICLTTGLTAWAFVQNGGYSFFSAGTSRSGTAVGTPAADDGVRRWLSDPRSQEMFLLARHHLSRRAGQRQNAREYLEQTVKSAPAFAEAHALLGEAYVREAVFDPSLRRTSWAKAEAAARRALALDPDLATAHAVLSRILLLRDWNWPAAAAESRYAIALDPNGAEPRAAYALYLRSAGRSAEAIVERQRAQRADPLNPQWLTFLGDEYVFARRYREAVGAYERALELERDYRPAVVSLADVYARMGLYADAAEWQLRALLLRNQKDLATAFQNARATGGPRAAIEWLDRRSLAEFQRSPDEHLWDLAYICARLGEREAAMRWLTQAYNARDSGMLQARVDPDLDSVRADPRFAELLRRIGP
jgi:tetratricopeptide (TPR) repeat protein